MAATTTTSRLPLVVLLLLLLAASSVVPATAGGKQHVMHGGARMVRRRSRVVGAAGGARANSNSRWRLVEDEVAAEELGAGQGSNSYVALDKEKTYCPTSSQCAGKPGGGSYTRPCTYENHCPQ